MNSIFISIVIPLYNKKETIRYTVESVLKQPYNDIEVIVVNDGSKDDSLLEIKDILDSRLKIYTINNSGVSRARNYGVSVANGDYILFLDADDVLYQNSVKTYKYLFYKYPNIDIYTTNFLYSEKNKYFLYTKCKKEKEIYNSFYMTFFRKIFIRTGNTIFKKKNIVKMGGFNGDISISEDLDFILRILKNSKVVYTPIPTYEYLRDNSELSLKIKPIEKHFAGHILVNGSFFERMIKIRYLYNYSLRINLHYNIIKKFGIKFFDYIIMIMLMYFNRIIEKIQKWNG